VTGGQPPRDWDKELAQIDKLIASGGSAPSQSPAPAAAPTPPRTGRAPRAAVAPEGAGRRGGGTHITWLRLLLGLMLGVAITQWPYVRGCGIPLFGYLVAVAGVIVAGLWSTVSSWRTRSGLAHVLSITLFCWGAVLAAREVLPRIGYARTPATWFCPAAPAAPAPQPAAPTRPQGAL
jgi:hypothetical protein